MPFATDSYCRICTIPTIDVYFKYITMVSSNSCIELLPSFNFTVSVKGGLVHSEAPAAREGLSLDHYAK